MIETLGGRKYIVSFLFSVLVFVAFILGKVSFEEFKSFFLILNGAYFTSNIISKFAPDESKK